MSTLKIKIANFFAKNSCDAWQSSRPVRKICRGIYRFIMEFGARDYPYANPHFADWPECDEEGKYSLITDSCNFVIRRSPSYIAWKIKRITGHWPKLPTPGKRNPGEHRFDAKHWDEVLEFNGWHKCDYGPIAEDADKGIHFVGVIASEGEFGQVVWFEGVETVYEASNLFTKYWDVSTYTNFREENRFILASPLESKVVWYIEPIPGVTMPHK
ncbi:hypothetical protein IKE82_01685 [Candidatus Saccharibacteria bacterium]|nr:hypothetical protein [Candidatus Saccharibacteria bacterium]